MEGGSNRFPLLKGKKMSVVKTPADLVSAVPFLIGYHPVNSLVVISVKDDALNMAMRVDLPEANTPAKAFDTLASHLKRDEAEMALIVAYSDDREANERVLNEMLNACTRAEIKVKEAMEIRAGKYRSVICQDETCCPADGNEMPDFKSARVTAEQVADGKVLPFESSEGLVASLDSNELATNKEFGDLVNSIINAENPENKGQFSNEFQRKGAEALNEMKLLFSLEAEISNELKAQVIAGVQDIQVRDYALGLFEDSEMGKNFYLTLFKSAPKEFSHPLASLASAYVYECGEGALAQRLLDKAIENDPEYSLSKLLRRVFSSGWPPTGFAQLRAELHPRVTATIFG